MNRLINFVALGSALTLAACAHSGSAPASTAQQDDPAYLFVQTARGVESGAGTLTLKGISPSTVYFTDRPERIAGHSATRDFVHDWARGEDSFRADPPNATLSVFGAEGDVTDVVVTLRHPRLEGRDLTYDVSTLEGDLPQAGGAAALFIDVLVVHAPLVRVGRGVVIR